MKKTIISLAIGFMVSHSYATNNAVSPVVSVTGSGTNTVTSSTAAGSYVNGAGSSLSKATNTQTTTSYVGGTGTFNTQQKNLPVSLEDCAPTVSMNGTLLTGAVQSFGGTSATGKSTASNVSTGAGTGVSQAVGSSIASIEGNTSLTSANMNLSAGGTAFSGVVTNTGVVNTNGSATSTGETSSAFKSTVSGSLFTYKTSNVAGDVKSITSNSYTRVGGIPQVSSSCGTSTCVTGPSLANNAIVEGGASSLTNSSIVANVKLGQ